MKKKYLLFLLLILTAFFVYSINFNWEGIAEGMDTEGLKL